MRSVWLVIFFFISFICYAQQDDLFSPYASYSTFYDHLSEHALDEREASTVIYSKHVFSRRKRIDLVKQLKSYIDRSALNLKVDSFPQSNNYYDSVTNQHVFIVAEGIALQKIGNNWYFSKSTVDNIPNLAQLAGGERETATVNLNKREEAQIERAQELAIIDRMPVDLSSPYATIKFAQENYLIDPAITSRIISKKDIPSLEDRIEVVEKLWRFFDGKGISINLDEVPDDPDYTDSTKAGKHTYELTYRYADLYLERDGKNWYLSKESAERIIELYNIAFPFGSDKLLKYLPTGGRRKFFSLFIWQYIAILLLVVLTYLIFKFINWVISFLVTKVLFRFGYKELATKYVGPVVRPFGLLIAFFIAETATPFLQLPIKITAFVSVSVSLLIPFFATIAIYNAMDIVSLYMKKMAEKTETTFDDQLVPIVRKILKTFVVIIGGVLVISNLGINMTVFFGTLSVGGLALALAAQDTIKNFFGSLMIFIDKPFQAGQWIVTPDGIDGTVESVGFRSTRIRTFENSVISVPNGKLSDAAINNYGLRSYRRFKTYLSVTYDTPPDVLELFIKGLRELVDRHPHTRKDQYHIYMNNMGSHSLDILFYIFFITPSWAEELKYRHEIIISIMKLAHELGINFAFPTQTLHMESFPGQLSMSPNYDPLDKLEPKMKQYFEGQEEPKGDHPQK